MLRKTTSHSERQRKNFSKKYKHHEGTLNWTDIDFWSRELNLDIPALKEQIRHMIEIHPHVEDFLKMLKNRKRKYFLLQTRTSRFLT